MSAGNKGLAWPVGIALGLLCVVLVNVAFIVAATSHPPQIDPSYETDHR